MHTPILADGTLLTEAIPPYKIREGEYCTPSFGYYLDSGGDWAINHLYNGQAVTGPDGGYHRPLLDCPCGCPPDNHCTVVSAVAWITRTRTGDVSAAEKIWEHRARISALLLESPYVEIPTTPTGLVFVGRIRVEFSGDTVTIRDFTNPKRVHADAQPLVA